MYGLFTLQGKFYSVFFLIKTYLLKTTVFVRTPALLDKDEFGGDATQVRVEEGKEPNHLIAMFGGGMAILSGNYFFLIINLKCTFITTKNKWQ